MHTTIAPKTILNAWGCNCFGRAFSNFSNKISKIGFPSSIFFQHYNKGQVNPILNNCYFISVFRQLRHNFSPIIQNQIYHFRRSLCIPSEDNQLQQVQECPSQVQVSCLHQIIDILKSAKPHFFLTLSYGSCHDL